MALDHSVDSPFTLRTKSRNMFTRALDLDAEGVGFGLSFGILRRRALTFSRQALSLRAKPFECAFELTRNLAQSLGNGRVLQ
jgi:hypothetical protein